jgi:putative DNA primase/helicase
MITLDHAARALGGERSGNTINCPGPGHSRRDRSLSVRLDPRAPDGFVVFSHCGDDWRECRDHVCQRLGLPRWAPKKVYRKRSRYVPRDVSIVAEQETLTEHDLRRIERAWALWEKASDPRDTIAEVYLRSRGLTLTDELSGHVLRFLRGCPFGINEDVGNTVYVPALIAAFRNIDTDEVTAIHRIGLTLDGQKIGRMMLGIVDRAAIKLAPITDGYVAIGEGVETAIAAQQLGLRPAWALGSVTAISSLHPIDGVNTISLLAETGTDAEITACARRWKAAGRRVLVRRPRAGTDLNDEIIGNFHAGL